MPQRRGTASESRLWPRRGAAALRFGRVANGASYHRRRVRSRVQLARQCFAAAQLYSQRRC